MSSPLNVFKVQLFTATRESPSIHRRRDYITITLRDLWKEQFRSPVPLDSKSYIYIPGDPQVPSPSAAPDHSRSPPTSTTPTATSLHLPSTATLTAVAPPLPTRSVTVLGVKGVARGAGARGGGPRNLSGSTQNHKGITSRMIFGFVLGQTKS